MVQLLLAGAAIGVFLAAPVLIATMDRWSSRQLAGHVEQAVGDVRTPTVEETAMALRLDRVADEVGGAAPIDVRDAALLHQLVGAPVTGWWFTRGAGDRDGRLDIGVGEVTVHLVGVSSPSLFLSTLSPVGYSLGEPSYQRGAWEFRVGDGALQVRVRADAVSVTRS